MASIKDFSEGNRVKVKCLEPELVAKGMYFDDVKIGDQGTVTRVDESGLVFVELDKAMIIDFLPVELEKI